MADKPANLTPRFADFDASGPTRLTVELSPDQTEALRRQLDLAKLAKTRLDVTLTPMGRQDWDLSARLGATVVQPCVVTLDPVSTRIQTKFIRKYRAQAEDPATLTSPEAEMSGDTDTEPLGDRLDLLALLSEELALALPAFPRKDTAQLDQAVFAEPGVDPMTDEDAKPFAVLAQLRDKNNEGPKD